METSEQDYMIEKNWIPLEPIFHSRKVLVEKVLWRFETVCIKTIACSSPHEHEKVMNELHVLSKCIHPKICQFLGACIEKSNIHVMMEYMHNGHLASFLQKNILDKSKKINLIYDICKGVHYLHNRKPEAVLHRDLKPENILINKNGEAKVADFGISKLVLLSENANNHTGEQGTYVWMAPEVVRSEDYDLKSDIYSLGLIIYFIWYNKKPFHQMNYSTIQLAFAKHNNTAVLEFEDEDEDDEIQELIILCTQSDSNNRLTTTEIFNYLQCL